MDVLIIYIEKSHLGETAGLKMGWLILPISDPLRVENRAWQGIGAYSKKKIRAQRPQPNCYPNIKQVSAHHKSRNNAGEETGNGGLVPVAWDGGPPPFPIPRGAHQEGVLVVWGWHSSHADPNARTGQRTARHLDGVHLRQVACGALPGPRRQAEEALAAGLRLQQRARVLRHGGQGGRVDELWPLQAGGRGRGTRLVRVSVRDGRPTSGAGWI